MPAGEDGSGCSDGSGSDGDDSDESSEVSSEDEDEEEEEHEDEEEGENEDEPLSLEWPDTPRKQATYLFLLPIVFPLWLTVPDVRNQVKTQTRISNQLWYLKCLNTVFPLRHIFCLTEIQKILCGHLLGLYSMDCYLLLPHGVVGPSGQLLVSHLEMRFEMFCTGTMQL